jgi:uncharacterized protein (DUF2235 family)
MGKNIVICSDGTGNAFSKQVSNVTLLIKSLELSYPETQIVFYDQGLGTNPNLVNEVKAYKSQSGKNRTGLEVLPEPKTIRLVPRPLTRLAGLVLGYGLRENVKEMYKALVDSYVGKEDQVYLFGFSRGAFTVRVLAGLIYRCGLLPKNDANFEESFSEAYQIYEPHKEDCDRINKFKNAYKARDCEIRFLGIWDTVKSYGGIWPQSLPHLRHNPIVKTVRHALALDERRSWFTPTSWGGIELDKKGSQGIRPDERYATQQVKEVWFCGFHSDVGGGDKEGATARIPFRWMLNEASACGLTLNHNGKNELLASDSKVPPEIHESLTRLWYITEIIPRWELDNTYRPPARIFRFGMTGKRCIEKFRCDGNILLHSSVRGSYSLKNECVEYVDTFTPKLIDDEKR